MKKFCVALIVVSFMLMASQAMAQPYLVCDEPNPAEGVTHYTIDLDGVFYEMPYPMHFDVGFLPSGPHEASAKAHNLWGESEWCLPLAFGVTIPTRPTGLRLGR